MKLSGIPLFRIAIYTIIVAGLLYVQLTASCFAQTPVAPLVVPVVPDVPVAIAPSRATLPAVIGAVPVSTAPAPIGVPIAKSFGGLTLGLGIGTTFNTGGQNRVVSATTVNNIVRVTQTANASVGLVGESHYFFVPHVPFLSVPAGDWGHGPFVAIDASAGNGDINTGFSLGWMIGFRQPTWTYDPVTRQWVGAYTNNSWNFGVGVRVDPKAQVLGDGIVANMPLPAGETSIRLKTEARYGLMLLSSFSF